MSDNIIDFNQRKREKDEAARENNDFSPEAMMSHLSELPENELMDSVTEAISTRMMRMLFLTDIGGKASEALKGIGFDPDNFCVDEESLDRYLATPFVTGEDDPQWNGPWFDWDAEDGSTVRLVTTIQVAEPSMEEGQPVSVSMNLLRLEEDADRWTVFTGDDWVEGPPADFFDFIDEWDGDTDDWDDEDDGDWDEDDGDWDEDEWTDADETSVCALVLRPTILAALVRAGIETFDQLRSADDARLLAIPGFDQNTLRRVREALDDLDGEADFSVE